MNTLGIEFWVQIMIYCIGFGAIYGTINTRLKYIEQKLDKHNSVVERTYKLEERCKSNTHRLDSIDNKL
jgi:hypothetical protein